LAGVAHEEPGPREDLLLLAPVDLLVDEDLAAHPAAVGIDEPVEISHGCRDNTAVRRRWQTPLTRHRPTCNSPGRHMVVLLLAAALLLPPVAAAAAGDDLACNQQPGNRYFWLERAFCDLPAHGPERAAGVVIWNHGISGTTQSWMAPAPPALRLLQARGWDVIMLKRHHAAESSGNTLYRTVTRTLEEAKALKKSGYRKVALAGQ